MHTHEGKKIIKAMSRIHNDIHRISAKFKYYKINRDCCSISQKINRDCCPISQKINKERLNYLLQSQKLCPKINALSNPKINILLILKEKKIIHKVTKFNMRER